MAVQIAAVGCHKVVEPVGFAELALIAEVVGKMVALEGAADGSMRRSDSHGSQTDNVEVACGRHTAVAAEVVVADRCCLMVAVAGRTRSSVRGGHNLEEAVDSAYFAAAIGLDMGREVDVDSMGSIDVAVEYALDWEDRQVVDHIHIVLYRTELVGSARECSQASSSVRA